MANGAAAAASRIVTSTIRSAVEIVSCAAAVMMKIASTIIWKTAPSGIGRSHCVAVRSTRSRTNPASTTPISRSASAARTFGRNSTPWFSDWLRNCRPSSDSAAKTTTTVSEIRSATASTCESERPRPARSSTSATPQRSEAVSRTAMRSARRSRRASPRATMIPTTSRKSAPPRRGMNPPSWSPAWSRIDANGRTALIAGHRGAGREARRRLRRPRPPACRRCAAAWRPRAGSAPAARRRGRRPGRRPGARRRAARAARRGAARRRGTVRSGRRSFGELPVVGVPAQHPDEVPARPEQADLHGAERRVGDRGDLLVAEALDVAQDERGAALRRQPAQLALEPRHPLLALETLGRQPGHGALGVLLALARLDRLGPAAVEVVDRGVVGDLQEPGPERGVGTEARQAVERAQERVLADVLGLLAPDDARRDADDDVAVALDERLERTQIAPQGRLHVAVVGVRRHAGRYVAGHASAFPRPAKVENPQLTAA